MKDNLAKRDDVPFEVAMAVTEALRKMDPDKEIVFAGDVAEDHLVHEGVSKFLEKFKSACENSLRNGTCWGCGETMPGWPYIMQEIKAGTELPDGWGVIFLHSGGHEERTPSAFECGNCNGPAIDDDDCGKFGVLKVDNDGTVTELIEPRDKDAQ